MTWLDESVSASLLPVPRKGQIKRVDLYHAWHNHAHSEFQDPATLKQHLDPLQPDAVTVTDDEDLNQLDCLRTRQFGIESEIADQLSELQELKSQQDALKKTIARRYEGSATNGSTLVQVVKRTAPLDYRKAFEFLGGVEAVLEKDAAMDDFRRANNTQQITIKSAVVGD